MPIWEDCRKFVNFVYSLCISNKKLAKDYSLVDQFRRAAISMCLNIAEGFERSSNKDFAHFVNIAKGSAGEVRSILYILRDNGYISEENFKELYSNILDISKQLATFRSFLLKNGDRRK